MPVSVGQPTMIHDMGFGLLGMNNQGPWPQPLNGAQHGLMPVGLNEARAVPRSDPNKIEQAIMGLPDPQTAAIYLEQHRRVQQEQEMEEMINQSQFDEYQQPAVIDDEGLNAISVGLKLHMAEQKWRLQDLDLQLEELDELLGIPDSPEVPKEYDASRFEEIESTVGSPPPSGTSTARTTANLPPVNNETASPDSEKQPTADSAFPNDSVESAEEEPPSPEQTDGPLEPQPQETEQAEEADAPQKTEEEVQENAEVAVQERDAKDSQVKPPDSSSDKEFLSTFEIQTTSEGVNEEVKLPQSVLKFMDNMESKNVTSQAAADNSMQSKDSSLVTSCPGLPNTISIPSIPSQPGELQPPSPIHDLRSKGAAAVLVHPPQQQAPLSDPVTEAGMYRNFMTKGMGMAASNPTPVSVSQPIGTQPFAKTSAVSSLQAPPQPLQPVPQSAPASVQLAQPAAQLAPVPAQAAQLMPAQAALNAAPSVHQSMPHPAIASVQQPLAASLPASNSSTAQPYHQLPPQQKKQQTTIQEDDELPKPADPPTPKYGLRREDSDELPQPVDGPPLNGPPSSGSTASNIRAQQLPAAPRAATQAKQSAPRVKQALQKEFKSAPGSQWGVGIVWMQRNGKLIVSGFVPGSEARACGVRHGDILRAVDSNDVLKMVTAPDGSHPASKLMLGAYQTSCKLSMLRVLPNSDPKQAGQLRSVDIEIKRSIPSAVLAIQTS